LPLIDIVQDAMCNSLRIWGCSNHPFILPSTQRLDHTPV
jgi:hypothetical protein